MAAATGVSDDIVDPPTMEKDHHKDNPRANGQVGRRNGVVKTREQVLTKPSRNGSGPDAEHDNGVIEITIAELPRRYSDALASPAIEAPLGEFLDAVSEIAGLDAVALAVTHPPEDTSRLVVYALTDMQAAYGHDPQAMAAYSATQDAYFQLQDALATPGTDVPCDLLFVDDSGDDPDRLTLGRLEADLAAPPPLGIDVSGGPIGLLALVPLEHA